MAGADDILDARQHIALAPAPFSDARCQVDPNGSGIAPIIGGVHASAAIQPIRAHAAIQTIVSTAANDPVVTAAAGYAIGLGVTLNTIVEIRASDIFDADIGFAFGVVPFADARCQVDPHRPVIAPVIGGVDSRAPVENVGTPAAGLDILAAAAGRSEEHTSELQSLMS